MTTGPEEGPSAAEIADSRAELDAQVERHHETLHFLHTFKLPGEGEYTRGMRQAFLENYEEMRGEPFRSAHARDTLLGSQDLDVEVCEALDGLWHTEECRGGPEAGLRCLVITDAWRTGRVFEAENQPWPIPRVWATHQRIPLADSVRILLLRHAGCSCGLPLVRTRVDGGVRCKLCGANMGPEMIGEMLESLGGTEIGANELGR